MAAEERKKAKRAQREKRQQQHQLDKTKPKAAPKKLGTKAN